MPRPGPLLLASALLVAVGGCGSRRRDDGGAGTASAPRDAAGAVVDAAVDAGSAVAILGVGQAGTPVGGLVVVGDAAVWIAGGTIVYVDLAKGGQRPVATDQLPLGEVALDGRGPLWVNRDDGAVMAGDLGAAPAALARLGDQACPGLASDGERVFVNRCGTVVTVPRAGGAATALAGVGDVAGPLAVAGDQLVVVTAKHQLITVPVGGGKARALGAPRATAVTALVVDGARAYWTEPPSRDVVSIALDGSEPEPRAELTAPCAPAGVAVTGDAIYATCPEAGLVVRGRRGAREVATVATDEASPTAIAVGARGVYWVAAGTGQLRGLTR